ncbi:MAG: hypothetical protein ACLQK4_01900 [Acidimicrobiales bacterium]|jgi:hypothetical protein
MTRIGLKLTGLLSAGLAVALMYPVTASASGSTFLGGFTKVTKIASTVPALGKGVVGNGDVNPYGTAVVPASTGDLVKGDVLISNFNNSKNLQGTGTTIMQISPKGKATVFARLGDQVSGPVGLTTALAVFKRGFVVVGSLPTTDGTAATAKAGALYVLDSDGKLVSTIAGNGINGPWDLASFDGGGWGALFVTNVLNGTVAGKGSTVNKGTVVRIVLDLTKAAPTVIDSQEIGSGYAEQTNTAALVLGPTGVGLGANGTLYVADTVHSKIDSIPDAIFRSSSAGTGSVVTAGDWLDNPLGLAVAPNGDILTVNGANGYVVETTPKGDQVVWTYLDTSGSPEGAGALFGLAVQPGNKGLYFVDDATNTLELFH